MQKTCRLKEKKNPTTALRGDWHKAGGLLLLSARAPRTEPDPGSEDWARPRLRPRPRPRPRGSARPLPAGPGRRRRHSLFPARKRTRHNRLFIYGGFFGVCAVCLGLVFSFFFFPSGSEKWFRHLSPFFCLSRLCSVRVGRVLWGSWGDLPSPQRGTLCFSSQPVLFPALWIAEDGEQEHEKLCPGQKKNKTKKDANPAQLSCKALS